MTTPEIQLHFKSPRREEPFVAFNCSSVNPNLLESRFLGYEKGAFTGADETTLGVFEIANGGTLFLDEIGELPLEAQGLLLRVLEEGRFQRLGGNGQEVEVDVRVIAATNRDLAAMVRDGKFRLDLYQRLEMQPELEFSLTPDQQLDFHSYYRSAQEQYYGIFGEDIIGSVRRLGLITFRIAMILSALRLHDTGEVVTTLICDDEDFQSAMAIARVLIRHTVRVYRELSSADLGKPAAERSDRQQQFLSSLPDTFSTQTFLQIAARLGIPQPTAERYIGSWRKSGLLNRIKQGYYEKMK